jgi:hypothetical protein
MQLSAAIFSWIIIVAGGIATFAFALLALGWAVVRLFEMLKVWHTLCLAIGVQLHGSKYRDSLFWGAVKERASNSAFAAKLIADFAMKHSGKGDI